MKTYLIYNKRTELYKIGRSNNPGNRLKSLDHIKGDLKLLCVIKKDCESILHNCFSKSHVGGEWFSLCENDVKNIIDYSNGVNNLTEIFSMMEYDFEVIKSNHFIALSCISILLNRNSYYSKKSLTQYLYNSEIRDFIKGLNNKIGVCVNTMHETYVHILLFLEIARTCSPLIKLHVYEILTDINKSKSHQIVRLALEEAKKA